MNCTSHLNSYAPRKTPLLKYEHCHACLKAFKQIKSFGTIYYGQVNTKIEHFGNNLAHVWRKAGGIYELKNSIPTVVGAS